MNRIQILFFLFFHTLLWAYGQNSSSFLNKKQLGCPTPSNLKIYYLGKGWVSLSWAGSSQHQAYSVQYRPKGEKVWTSKNNINSTGIDIEVRDNTHYEWLVLAECSKKISSPAHSSFEYQESKLDTTVWGGVNNVISKSEMEADERQQLAINKLADVSNIAVYSGKTPTETDVNNFWEQAHLKRPKCATKQQNDSNTETKKNNLKVGDLLIIGSNECMVTELESSYGEVFSGKGVLNLAGSKARFPVYFTNITIVGNNDEPGGCVVGMNHLRVESSSSTSVQVRLQQLYQQINDPEGFTGTLEQARTSVEEQSDILLKMEAEKKTISKEQISKYRNVCKALRNGIEEWIESIKIFYGTTPDSEIIEDISDLEKQSQSLLSVINCYEDK